MPIIWTFCQPVVLSCISLLWWRPYPTWAISVCCILALGTCKLRGSIAKVVRGCMICVVDLHSRVFWPVSEGPIYSGYGYSLLLSGICCNSSCFVWFRGCGILLTCFENLRSCVRNPGVQRNSNDGPLTKNFTKQLFSHWASRPGPALALFTYQIICSLFDLAPCAHFSWFI